MTDLKQISVEATGDGSSTLNLSSLGEHYHSTNGAVAEANHIFINAALSECESEVIHVFEVGFGTGLNALLTAQFAEENDKIVYYTSIELHPLPYSLLANMNYTNDATQELYKQLHSVEWGKERKISDHFYLTKIESDLTCFDFSAFKNKFDVIYFDAFSPNVQEHMWTQAIFDSMHHIAQKDAVMTTYCAKGAVRRSMQAAGFTVERLAGPPGKREILRARKK